MNDLIKIALSLLTSLGVWFLVFQTSLMRFRFPFPLTRDEYNGELLRKGSFLWYYHYNCEGCQAVSTSILAACMLGVGYFVEGHFFLAFLTLPCFLAFLPLVRLGQSLISLSLPFPAGHSEEDQNPAGDQAVEDETLDQILASGDGRSLEPDFKVSDVLFFFGQGPCTFEGCQELRARYQAHLQELESAPQEDGGCKTGCDKRSQLTRVYMRKVKHALVKQGLL